MNTTKRIALALLAAFAFVPATTASAADHGKTTTTSKSSWTRSSWG